MSFTNRRENRERTKTLTVMLRLMTKALLVDFSFMCFISRPCSCESHLGPQREREREMRFLEAGVFCVEGREM